MSNQNKRRRAGNERSLRRQEDNRLDILSSTVANLDARLPALTKAILDFGARAAWLVGEQSRQKSGATDRVARVAKLEEIASKLIEPAA